MDSITFCDLINKLNIFWKRLGCFILPSFDMEVGAGTFHPSTFLRSIGPEYWKTAYIQLSRRPSDGNYLQKQNKRQQFMQYQVLLKPSPLEVQNLYLESLLYLGIDIYNVDIKFIEDNWESPTLGACGVGWEVWLNGIEVSQFTYFQQMGGIVCEVISCELTYGLERIALHLQKKKNISALIWDTKANGFFLTYGDIYNQTEIDLCLYNFELTDVNMLLSYFIFLENECNRLLHFFNVESAYELVVKISHIFNLLDARFVFSPVERKNYISRIRKLSNCVAKIYYLQREFLYFPLIKV